MAGRSTSTALRVLLLLAMAPVFARGQGTLQQVREEVRREDPAPPPQEDRAAKAKDKPAKKKDEGTISPWQPDEEDEEEDSLLSGLFKTALAGAVVVASIPYVAPHAWIEGREPKQAYFARYPYANAPGSMLHDMDDRPGPPSGIRPWNRQVWLEYGDDFSGLSRASGKLLMDRAGSGGFVERWGFDASASYWRETLAAGGHDQLWTGDANVLYRFANNERVQLRSGVGLNWLADEMHGDVGFNFTYGGDFYPCKPLVLTAELDAGWLGSAWLVHLRATTGIVWRRTEFYVGYDWLRVSDIDLDGLATGLRFSF